MSGEYFSMRDIVKQYRMGDEVQEVLRHVNLDLEEGEFLSILGPSGSGKSTMMNIIGCLDTPTSGTYILRGRDIGKQNQHELAQIRCREIGFIFQSFQLLPRMNALKNVELPLIYAGVPGKEREKRAKETLERVGLSDRMYHYPNQLSGGQQQRVAIARAIAHRPKIIFADEPTGELDTNTGLQVVKIFKQLTECEGVTIVMTTHDTGLMEIGDAVYELEDGEQIHGRD